jgi:hypothetical protein
MELKFLRKLSVIIFLLPVASFAQDTFDFYISNAGKDTYPGNKKFLPRKTIAATEPLLANCFKIKGSVKVGLKSGDIFNENLITSYLIQLSAYTDYNISNNYFAILND